MEVDGSTSITLAFSLSALQELDDPAGVVEGTRRWSENVGVLSEEKHIEITDFAYDYGIRFDFTSGPRPVETAINDSKQMLPTDRHIYLGTGESHEELAEEYGWEFLPIKEAAAAAEWKLSNGSQDIEYDGDPIVIEEQMEEDQHTEVPVNTLRWHQINRGEKEWIVRPVNNDFNEETLPVDQLLLLKRGVGEGHKLWAVVREVDTFNSVDELLEEIPYDKIRPHGDEETVADRMRDTLNEADEYIAFRVQTVDPEANINGAADTGENSDEDGEDTDDVEDEGEFSCEECSFTTDSERGVKIHATQVHGNNESDE